MTTRKYDIQHFSERQSHHIFSYDEQKVSDIVNLSERQSDHILSYDQQRVSDVGPFFETLIMSCPMTHSL